MSPDPAQNLSVATASGPETESEILRKYRNLQRIHDATHRATQEG